MVALAWENAEFGPSDGERSPPLALKCSARLSGLWFLLLRTGGTNQEDAAEAPWQQLGLFPVLWQDEESRGWHRQARRWRAKWLRGRWCFSSLQLLSISGIAITRAGVSSIHAWNAKVSLVPLSEAVLHLKRGDLGSVRPRLHILCLCVSVCMCVWIIVVI